MTADRDRSGVLILDADAQCSLAVIRSLGSKGVPVTAGDSSPRALGMRSRYSDGTYVHPDMSDDPAAFVAHLRAHLDRDDYFAVFPIVDHTCAILARHKETLEQSGTLVVTEDSETFREAFDKRALFEAIDDVDVPTPETFAPASVAELVEHAESLPYPTVIKPRSKSYLHDDGFTVRLITDENYVDTPADLVRTYERIAREQDGADGDALLVQEYIPGRTTTCVGLADDGELIAYFQEERLRTYPSSGGNSALLAALNDPTMLDYSRRVIGRLRWTGPIMVEFMRTPSGEYYLIEVNGRYWGSLPFAIECGVDFPWLHYLQLRGIDPSPFVSFGEYRTDVVQRRLLYEDVKWFAERLGRGDFGAVVPFLRAFHEARHTFVNLYDPVPTYAALVQAGRLGFKSLQQRLIG